ncbi:hypothetical protein KDA08_04030, partial [Candidatus Saccharibacteria bacterium]|nr:hypothetical protein [Candidatus Saccharibacteria bacterium]
MMIKKILKFPLLFALLVVAILPEMSVYAATKNEKNDILRSSEWTNADGESICVSNNNGNQIDSGDKTVVLDPGHDGTNGESIDPASGLLTTTTTNN